MRVQCCLCVFEKDGFCLKKKKRGNPIKIKPTKRRTCDLYSEDGMRVFSKFRAKEAHNASVKRQALRRAQLAKAIEQARQAGVTAFAEEVKDDQNGNA